MGCELRKRAPLAVIAVEGKLVMGALLDEFRAAWGEALAAGCRNLVIDLTQVPAIDSSAIGSLIRCHSAAVASRGRVCLVGPNSMVRHVLELNQLHTILKAFDDQASAIAALETSAGGAKA